MLDIINIILCLICGIALTYSIVRVILYYPYTTLCNKFLEKPWTFIIIILLCSWLSLFTIFILIEYSKKEKYNYSPIYEEHQLTPLDSIVNERAHTKFNNTIFAGIQFGDREDVVNQKLLNYKNKFGNAIYADSTVTFINKIDTEYYKGKLYTLTINIGSAWNVHSELWTLFEKKYGKTKFNDWIYLDAIIDYKEIQVNKPAGIKPSTYTNEKWYYDEDGHLTHETKYESVIIYQSKSILEEKRKDEELEYQILNKERQRQDSIRRSVELKNKIRAKELSTNQIEYI